MPTLVRGGVVLPMSGPRQVLDPGSVLVDGTGIVAVGDVATLDADPRAADGRGGRRHRARRASPACTTATCIRGCCGARPSRCRCGTGCAPTSTRRTRRSTPEIARVASLHCYAEGLLAGTTSVMDMWRYMEGSAAVAADLGIRATLVPYVADAEGYDYFESIASNRKLLEAVPATAPAPTGGCGPGSASSTSCTARPSASPRPWRWPTSSPPASTPTRPRRCGRSASRSAAGDAGRSRCSPSGGSSGRGPSWPTASGSTTARSSCWRRPAPPWPTARART